MGQAITLTALDLGVARTPLTGQDVVWESLELAPDLERHGFARYWIAEHHTRDAAHSSPEIMTALIAGVTKKMRVGPAGVLMRFHSPFKVACDFRLLEAVFPRRIDLGLARGGVDPRIQELLLGTLPTSDDYPDRVQELLRFVNGAGDRAPKPRDVPPPAVWILGSKRTSMELAARLGVAFCLSLFLDADSAEAHAVIDAYRKTFVQSEHMAAPKWAIAVAGACASSAEKAKALAAEPASFVFPSVVGSPSECRDICTRLCEQYETTDLVFADVCRDKEAHRESLLSLASALGATAPAED